MGQVTTKNFLLMNYHANYNTLPPKISPRFKFQLSNIWEELRAGIDVLVILTNNDHARSAKTNTSDASIMKQLIIVKCKYDRSNDFLQTHQGTFKT